MDIKEKFILGIKEVKKIYNKQVIELNQIQFYNLKAIIILTCFTVSIVLPIILLGFSIYFAIVRDGFAALGYAFLAILIAGFGIFLTWLGLNNDKVDDD